MTEAIRALNWRLMRALLAGLMLAGAAVTVAATTRRRRTVPPV